MWKHSRVKTQKFWNIWNMNTKLQHNNSRYSTTIYIKKHVLDDGNINFLLQQYNKYAILCINNSMFFTGGANTYVLHCQSFQYLV